MALRRAEAFVAVGAKVSVVAPECDPEFANQLPEVTCKLRAFEDTDIQDIFLVVIATDDKVLNDHINILAHQHNVLVNRTDDPDAGDISIPAHAHCGPVTLAVHTNRISASAAASIRDTLIEQVDPAWPALLSAMAPYRQRLQETVPDTFVRQKMLKRMADEQALTLIKELGVAPYLNFCESLMSEITGEQSGETCVGSDSK